MLLRSRFLPRDGGGDLMCIEPPTLEGPIHEPGPPVEIAAGAILGITFRRGHHKCLFASTVVGRFESTVDEQYVPYINPQEHGHHPDTRWLRLTDRHGKGLEVRGLPVIGFGASHFTAGDLTAARHTIDLEPRPEVFLSLDLAQRGLGTASCGPDTGKRYRLLDGRYEFSFSLREL